MQSKRKTKPVKRLRRTPRQRRSLNARPRTLGSVVNALGSKSPPQDYGSHYLSCRLSPFNAGGRAAIPDGSNSNFIVVDAFSVNSISASTAGQSFIIQTTPTLPSLAMISSLNNITVDGVVISASTGYQPGGSLGTSWTPICIPSSFSLASCIPGTLYADPWNSTAMRFVTFGFRILYTGPVTTCAGSIVVTPNNIAYVESTSVVAAGLNVSVGNASAVSVGNLPSNTPILSTDFNANLSAMTRASRSFRPEQGIELLSRHAGTTYELVPLMTTPGAPILAGTGVAPSTTVPCILRQTGIGGQLNGGIIAYDNAWSGFQIAFNNVNADASFRVEAVVCLEVNPSITSAFYPLTQKSSPMQKGALDAVNAALEKVSIRQGDDAHQVPPIAQNTSPGSKPEVETTAHNAVSQIRDPNQDLNAELFGVTKQEGFNFERLNDSSKSMVLDTVHGKVRVPPQTVVKPQIKDGQFIGWSFSGASAPGKSTWSMNTTQEKVPPPTIRPNKKLIMAKNGKVKVKSLSTIFERPDFLQSQQSDALDLQKKKKKKDNYTVARGWRQAYTASTIPDRYKAAGALGAGFGLSALGGLGYYLLETPLPRILL